MIDLGLYYFQQCVDIGIPLEEVTGAALFNTAREIISSLLPGVGRKEETPERS